MVYDVFNLKILDLVKQILLIPTLYVFVLIYRYLMAQLHKKMYDILDNLNFDILNILYYNS